MTGPDDFGLAAVVRQLARSGGGGFEWYKDSCLLRRIEVRMRARGVGTMSGYAMLLSEDQAEVERLLHTLSVRVTGFFRNPDTWSRLLELLAADRMGTAGTISAWSMACATGEEAWSLAMLLLAHARQSGGVPPAEAIRVIGSDVDAQALDIAVAGWYPSQAAAAIRLILPHTYGALQNGGFEVDASVRDRVTFQREDLTAVVPRRGWCDLVCCRNVLIFLGHEGQRRLLDAACTALRPGGLLVLGRTESLVAIPEAPLRPVDVSHRIYRRLP